MSIFRRLFEDFSSTDLAARAATPLAADFAQFRAAGGTLLADSCAIRSAARSKLFRRCVGLELARLARTVAQPGKRGSDKISQRANESEVPFHCFLQWIADRSFAAAQRATRQAGCELA